MSGTYYDIDDILSDSQKLPCKFNITVPGLGYLEGNPGKPIVENTKIELPLWLAEVLAICELAPGSNKSFIELVQPDFFSSKVINAIKTSACTVDLHSILANYYRLTEKWGAMFNDEELIEVVSQMLKERAAEINDFASNSSKQVNNNFIYSFDEFEKRLFRIASDSHKQVKNWMRNQ